YPFPWKSLSKLSRYFSRSIPPAFKGFYSDGRPFIVIVYDSTRVETEDKTVKRCYEIFFQRLCAPKSLHGIEDYWVSVTHGCPPGHSIFGDSSLPSEKERQVIKKLLEEGRATITMHLDTEETVEYYKKDFNNN
ncbi:MAG: hypothetical protein AAF443_06535, partial [Chlamydiota bacterium]